MSEFRMINEANNSRFSELVDNADWSTLSGLTGEDRANEFFRIYDRIYNNAYPLSKNRKRRKNERILPKPWITPWLEDACNRKNSAYHEWVKNKTTANKVKYEKLRAFCKKHTTKAKNRYYTKYFKDYSDNSKKQWDMINKLLNRNKNKGQTFRIRDEKGNIINESDLIANRFNNYFSGIASNLKSEMDPETRKMNFTEFLGPSQNASIALEPTNPGEVRYIINNFKNKSTLDTKISSLKIASTHTLFLEELTLVLNESLRLGIFPEQLKFAKVVPVHKGGDKTLVENYRPISLLTTFSKVFEKVMYSRLYSFFSENGILNDNQFGFRAGRSCEQALLTAQKTILDSLDKKKVALLLLIDFSKAFDMVEHEILLYKLKHYGIRGKAWDWIKSYLTNREQYVSINGKNSTRTPLLYGVPQGSILGPLFFIIYINDLPHICDLAKFILYADDANIIVTGDDIEDVKNNTMKLVNNLVYWVGGNGLLLNLKKTKFMIFSKKRNVGTFDLKINNVHIEKLTEARFLGVIVDDKFTWKSHIHAIKTKMARYVGILFKIKFHVPLKVRLQIYHSFVQSHLNYCSLLWGFACKSLIDSIFVKQKKAMRAVMPGFVRYYYKDGELPSGTKTSFKNYGILTVHGIIAKATIQFMYKYHHTDNLPHSVREIIDVNAPKYLVDESNNLITEWYSSHNNNIYRNSLCFKGPLLFSDPKLKPLVTPMITAQCIKFRTKKVFLEYEHSGDPENWNDSTFFIHKLQGIRKSKRIGADAPVMNTL